MMKRLCSLLSMMLIILSACGKPLNQVVYTDSMFLSSFEDENGIIECTYYAQSPDGYNIKQNDAAFYAPTPKTFDAVMQAVREKNGIVVAGYAYGIREGYYQPYNETDDVVRIEGGYTKTSFHIEKLYYGSTDTLDVTVLEGYVYKEDDNNQVYCYIPTGESTFLKNDQSVLLYLVPSNSGEEGQYYPIYTEAIDLQEGYAVYEDYIAQICAYYRGERTAYQFPDVKEETVTVELQDGTDVSERFRYGGVNQDFCDVSDADLIKTLLAREDKTSMMIYTAMEFKIQIYPKGHIRNPIDIEEKRASIGKQILMQYETDTITS